MNNKYQVFFGRYFSYRYFYGWRLFFLRIISAWAMLIDAIISILTLGFIESEFYLALSEPRIKIMMDEYRKRKEAE